MKKLKLLLTSVVLSLFFLSCTTEDVKEISGTLIFNEIGSHTFNINAENIEATITVVGPNKGESFVFENVSLYRTVDYTAKIGLDTAKSKKTELLNNLVVMYEANSGKFLQNDLQSIAENGYVKIDWKGIN